jgi:hypothetical protein
MHKRGGRVFNNPLQSFSDWLSRRRNRGQGYEPVSQVETSDDNPGNQDTRTTGIELDSVQLTVPGAISEPNIIIQAKLNGYDVEIKKGTLRTPSIILNFDGKEIILTHYDFTKIINRGSGFKYNIIGFGSITNEINYENYDITYTVGGSGAGTAAGTLTIPVIVEATDVDEFLKLK